MFLELPDTGTWLGLYYTALRIAILSAVAAGAGLCLKVLRAYMNMRERNLHRQRLANSIEAFVISAQTPEVRDFILAHLVEAVASFGSSGLLTREAEPIGSRNLPADTVLRLLSGQKGSP